ncbi:MAG: hypothetical protein M1813_000008 [Trichoglossum hirsutum]|nr:MAG: hypothetical protein M1813_000008 [Trichoglossum hirsutum]
MPAAGPYVGENHARSPADPTPARYVSSTTTTTTPQPIAGFESLTSEEIRASLIPWTWRVQSNTIPTDPEPHCPSASAILGTFTVVNITVSLLGLLFGHRKVVHWLTCTLWGRPEPRFLVQTFLLWIFPFTLQILANYLVASTIQKSPGYTRTPVSSLMLLFLSRPRLGWIVLYLFGQWGKTVREIGYLSSSAMAALIAEVLLELGATYYMGRTAHFAATRGLYLAHHAQAIPYGSDALMMYAGALLFLLCIPGIFICATAAVMSFWAPVAETERKAADRQVRGQVVAFLMFGALGWVANWLFWAGFVRLAGNL